MKRIQDSLKRLSSSDFHKRYQEVRKDILQNPDVSAFLEKHRDEVNSEVLDKSLGKLYEYISQSKDCEGCPDLSQCRNMMKGYEPVLVMRKDSIDIEYRRCQRKIIFDEQRKTEKLIQSIYVPKEVLKASFETFDFNTPGRIKALKYAEEFVANYHSEKQQRGLYLYGHFGVGKSYLLGAIANELANIGVPSYIVYFPEFVREMKQSLNDNSINEKLDMIKKTPVLMLDDVGAESVSSWLRDDILGPILQYRSLERLPTFFSSNFDYDELEFHFSHSQRGEEEKLKAARIMERIKFLTIPVKLDGPNRRER
jgi:primosomal protein DnaI